MQAALDVETLVDLLWAVEAEADVKTFVSEYVGTGGNVFQFVREFVDRRKAIQSRTGATGTDDGEDDPDDFQVKQAGKKKGKGKFTKVPASLLNFKTEAPPPQTPE